MKFHDSYLDFQHNAIIMPAVAKFMVPLQKHHVHKKLGYLDKSILESEHPATSSTNLTKYTLKS